MQRRRPGGLVGVQVSTEQPDELLELQRSHENLRKSDSFDKHLSTKRKLQLAEYYTSSSQCPPHDRDDTASDTNDSESPPTTFTLGQDIPRKKKHGASVSFHPEIDGGENTDDDDDHTDDESDEEEDEDYDDDKENESGDDDSDGLEVQKYPESTDESRFGKESKRRMSRERRPSQVASKNRRPSYTCYHGPPLPRNTPKIGKRSKAIKRLRERDVLQLAAGTVVMLSPLTPELLRYNLICQYSYSLLLFLTYRKILS